MQTQLSAADYGDDMTTNRRTFLQETLLSGGLAGLVGSDTGRHGLSEHLFSLAGQIMPPEPAAGKHDSRTFWDNFGATADNTAGDAPVGVHGRGLIHNLQPTPAQETLIVKSISSTTPKTRLWFMRTQ
jgi:hypothetical protein